jgi:acetyltransferase
LRYHNLRSDRGLSTELYQEQNSVLDMFFSPQAVAVIGASRTPGKLGYAVLNNIVQHGYEGKIYPINPNAEHVLGLKCYPSILMVPEPVELATIVIPSRYVAQTLVECGQKGVKGAVVISAGFREVGSEGWQREREIVEIGKRYNMRLLGPNSLGIIDTIAGLNASFAADMPQRGTIAFVSQSGALCTAVLDMALAEGVGFSRFVSLGNKADVDEIAFIEALQDDDETDVIMAYLEGIERGPEFMEVARQASSRRPIIAIKSGTTHAGSRAVSSHTGTLAGSEQAYETAFRQSGVIRARSIQDMVDYAIAFARQPLLPDDHIAIVTNAGGPGIMATDACERAGLQIAALEPQSVEALHQALPVAASVLNPIDLLGDASARRYAQALDWVAQDGNVNGIIVIVTPQIMTEIQDTAHVVGMLSQRVDKPILGCFMGQVRIKPGIDILNEYRVPNYPVPERAVAALAAMMRHRRWRERPPLALEQFEVDRARVRSVLDRVRGQGRLSIGDTEAREIMAAYGLETPITCLARNPDEAVCLAKEIGFPVALKIASPDILHKTDVGGVRLNITQPEDVRQAYQLMIYRASRYMPDAEIWGCLVQEMVTDGKEVIVGMHHDPHFGPLMTFCLGGIYVETIQDVSFRVVPFDRRDTREMITDTQAYNLLRGVRGEGSSDIEALTDAILRLEQLAIDFPEIVELDLNPLTVLQEGQGIVAVDMRLVLE